MQNSVPVLYYHSVGNHTSIKPWSFLTCDTKTFKLQMQFIKKLGYNTCHMSELEQHLLGKNKLPDNTIHLQFDDGFLDNWTVVYPIMKKLGIKFTILVSPDFIDNSPVRNFCDETSDENLNDWWGYLSELELKELANDPLVDIQAHGYTHTWYPSSDKLIGVCKNNELMPWIYWNDNVSKKSSWLTNLNEMNTYTLGRPIFEYAKSLSNLRAFIPNKEFIDECMCSDVTSHDTHQQHVLRTYNRFKENDNLGRYETKEETVARLTKELLGARDYISKIIEREVRYLVWPGGGNNSFVQNLAFDCGYYIISKGDELNSFASNNRKISRVAAYKKFKPKYLSPYLNVLLFFLQIKRAEGNRLLIFIINTVKRFFR